MKVSAGILIILNNKKILFCHPSNAKWDSMLGPPKGGVNISEDLIDAAIRETKEEISVIIDKNMIKSSPIEINYSSRNGILYKKVYLYRVDISSISEIGMTSEIIDKNLLQAEEIDWAGFLTKSEASSKIFFRFRELLDLI